MGLIIPKNNAEKRTIDATLKVYYEAKDWLANQDLIDRLSSSLINLGIENEKKNLKAIRKKLRFLLITDLSNGRILKTTSHQEE